MSDPDSNRPTPIASRTIGDYLETLGSSDPTPGGGSVGGVIGALGAGLGLMVISLTTTSDSEASDHLDAARAQLDSLRDRFVSLAEQDEAVYQSYRDAAALPKGSPQEKMARREAMQLALKDAATVPMHACEAAVELGKVIVPVQQYGNPYLLSDARIAALCASSCFESSRINVNVNLAMIKDDTWITEASNRLESLAAELHQHLHAV